jgi:hypothetical protein
VTESRLPNAVPPRCPPHVCSHLGRMFLTSTPSFALPNVSATLASMTLESTFLYTVDTVSIGPLWMWFALFVAELRKKWPPILLQDFGSKR